MNAQQLTQVILKAIEDQEWNEALAVLTDDFRFSGAVPEPVTGEQWIGVHKALAVAMPDLRMNYIATGEGDQLAEGTVALTGRHTGEFVLPMPGIPRVPATGKQIANPRERVWVTVRGDKIANIKAEQVPDGGVVGILKQMGVALPHA